MRRALLVALVALAVVSYIELRLPSPASAQGRTPYMSGWR